VSTTQNGSVTAPLAASSDIGRLLFEASRRAEAMGLVEPHSMAHLRGSGAPGSTAEIADIKAVRHIAQQARKAGIAAATASALNNVEAPTREELASLLRMMITALEASPVPKFEWAGLARVFDVEQLSSLLDVSISSLKRYQSGERATPDAVAARLHFLVLVVSDLAGSYNDIGIRRWFHRRRTLLDGRAPVHLLAGDWDPDEPGPRRVRELAGELVSLSAT